MRAATKCDIASPSANAFPTERHAAGDPQFLDNRRVHRVMLGLEPGAAGLQPVRAEAPENIAVAHASLTLQLAATFDELRNVAEKPEQSRHHGGGRDRNGLRLLV